MSIILKLYKFCQSHKYNFSNLHKNIFFTNIKNMKYDLQKHYDVLYNSSLKDIDKNLENFIKSKREISKSSQ